MLYLCTIIITNKKYKIMKALVNTKSNYRNLNGTWVEVKQFLGTLVACETYCEEFGKNITFDLALTEIKEIK